MISYMLTHAEFLALGLNTVMTIAFLIQMDWAKSLYWGGATCVVLGVIMMR